MGIFKVERIGHQKRLLAWGHEVFRWTRTGKLLADVWRGQQFLVQREQIRQHFGICIPIEAQLCWTGRYEVIEVSLGELYRNLGEAGRIPFGESALVRYCCTGDECHLRTMYRRILELGWLNGESEEEFVKSEMAAVERLRCAPEGDFSYDPARCCIVVDQGNAIVDGCHRAAVMWARGQKDARIRVVRVLPGLSGAK